MRVSKIKIPYKLSLSLKLTKRLGNTSFKNTHTCLSSCRVHVDVPIQGIYKMKKKEKINNNK